MEDKQDALRKEQQLNEKLAQWRQMEEALQQLESEKQQLVAQTHQVKTMFEDGVIKQDPNGNYVPVLDPSEKEQIRQTISLSKQRPAAGSSIVSHQNHDLEDDGLE